LFGDRLGTIKLGISAASELNQIITDQEATNTNFEEVAAITLDSLVISENLQTVDILKLMLKDMKLVFFKVQNIFLTTLPQLLCMRTYQGHRPIVYPLRSFLGIKAINYLATNPMSKN